MTVHFKKYHGLGNDYLVIDPSVFDVAMTQVNIRLICDRNFGVGSDGILYGPTFDGDLPVLRIFNPDGSEAEKSGNGLRIFAKYLFEKRYVRSKSFKIKTLGGVVDVQVQDKTANLIRINMGKVTFTSNEIPVAGEPRQVVNEPLDIDGVTHNVTCLSIGNPHCVIPMPEVSEAVARALGPHVENHRMFPNRINMQIVRVIDRANIDVRIWERGAGYTLASGSSSCAAAAASHKLGLVDGDITVHMPGGTLHIEITDDGQIHMTGPVEGTFEGRFHSDLLSRIQNPKS
ncbi:MAG TPA: diaminopimelate epimerase [Sedimentisphaerales bacterium]|nr:diaminopimelate epimerase [Sedimentisphaerales bacterium]HNU30437.1 diaminopimelate epimerase [Sedimentisphaerales bacterium]